MGIEKLFCFTRMTSFFNSLNLILIRLKDTNLRNFIPSMKKNFMLFESQVEISITDIELMIFYD